MELYYRSSAIKVIKKFTQEEKQIFKEAIQELKESPEVGGFLKGSLKGLRKWKYRVGGVPFRIVYQISKNRIDIIAVGKRKDFYELIK